MNCAERLVEVFGSQAEVARAFQIDRAVVHHWVKLGYIPARWAGEVERVTQGRISAVDVVNEASVKNPVRVKSRPGDAPFGILSESDAMPTSQYAPSKRIQSFHPPQRTLMGPGPTEIHPRVLTTMSQPAVGYLDPIFVEMMEELKSLLRYVYQTRNALTFPLSGPGSVGMEYCFVNMVAPGDKVVVCQNGVFGGRMLENAIRCGGTPVVVEDKWGEPVDPQKLEDALKKNRDAKIVAFVHAETSTGCQSDAK
ncbi:MAG: YdaS family helix-turn-helix protein, partial [Betaproteobacteria bacterium]